MASIYGLIANSGSVHNEIIRENMRLEQPIKKRHFAVITIQRCYRGYLVRKRIKYMHQMATIIQKVVRGWLVRWHRVDYLKEYLEAVEKRDLNAAATKIQAIWKGYKVRKNMNASIKERVQTKQAMRKRSLEMRNIFRDKFKALREQGGGVNAEVGAEEKKKIGEECKRWVLFILFKTHHLVRTKCREGVYSMHGSDDLSQIETWMKSLPMKKYMRALRRLYNQNYTEEQMIEYMFTDKKLKHMEYLYRTRDRSREARRIIEVDKSIHEKPFELYKRPKEKPYEKVMLNTEKYTRNDNILLRSFSRCSTDFDLFVHKPGEPPKKPPPYYVDFWSSKCKIHYCTYD